MSKVGGLVKVTVAPGDDRVGARGVARRAQVPRSTAMAALAVVAMLAGQVGWIGAGPAAAAAPDRDVIVVLKDREDPAKVARELGVKVKRTYRHVFNGFAGRLPAMAAQGAERNPHVETISDDLAVAPAGVAMPAGIDRADADRHPVASIDGVEPPPVDADVAVLDTGIDPRHPDLNVAGGVDCVGAGSWADDNGHGTHVAGTIGAKDNGDGVVGVAPGARLWAVKVLRAENGTNSYSDVICGLDWVVANASRIDAVNLSLGGPGSEGTCSSSAFRLAICRTVGAGVTVVAAAMNNGANAANYVPATYPEVITVSAFADYDGRPGGTGGAACGTPDDAFALFSNYGADVDIAAPGVCVTSTAWGGGTGTKTGTSMAAPHVAGAVALFKAANPAAGPDAVRSWLLGTASRPQGSADGFTRDQDNYPEPVLHLDAGWSPPGSDPDPEPGPSAGAVLPIVGDGRSPGSSNARLAYDGDDRTCWVTTSSGTPTSAAVWFDLGERHRLGEIRWQFHKVGYADEFRIQISNDRKEWRTLATRGNSDRAHEWRRLGIDASARYVRFLFRNPNDDRYLGCLGEVEIRA